MRFQTPMSALGLPQTRPRSRDVPPVTAEEAALFRRRRTLAAMALVALCLCVMMTWRLVLQLPPPDSPRHTFPGALEAPQQTGVKQEKRQAEKPLDSVQQQREPRGFRDEKKIVVVLSHFRDSEACAQALLDARALAFQATRVHFRIFEELYLAQEQTCVQRFCELQPEDCATLLRSRQLRTQRRDASGALGTTVARFLAEGMVERERFADDFYLSVDPVVVFTHHWDLRLLKQWYSIGNDMAIVSVAPKSVELKGQANTAVLVQCSARIYSKDQDTVVVFNSPEPVPHNGAALFAPMLQSQYSEFFHFGPIRALLDVRSDPHTPLVSLGHEYARATRFWTRGYDFYAPNEDVLFARYTWHESPLPLRASDSDIDAEQQQEHVLAQSNRRIRQLLGLPVSVDNEPLEQSEPYALGQQRSMAAWQEFSGIDPNAAFNESTTNQFTICGAMARGQLHYVPYEMK